MRMMLFNRLYRFTWLSITWLLPGILFFIPAQTLAIPSQPTEATTPITCTGDYQGRVLSRDEVAALLQARIQQYGADYTVKLNLCGSILANADLSQMNLNHVNFDLAKLHAANFTNSDLSQSTLRGADLSNANLHNTYLRWSDLNHAFMNNAHLQLANLSDANLTAVNLDGANLANVTMQNSKLVGITAKVTNFFNAKLADSDFSNASLLSATFSQAEAVRVNFSHAQLHEAKFDQVNLAKANLSNSNWLAADLSQAQLMDSNLLNANFKHANFFKVNYQPQLGKMPSIMELASVKQFISMQFYDPDVGAPALIELRTAYKLAGIRPMERLITSMLKQKQTRLARQQGGMGWINASLSYVLFEITCEFGLAPQRPLAIMLSLILLFAVPYRFALRAGTAERGIFQRFAEGEILLLTTGAAHSLPHAIANQLRYGWLAVYYSILSAFQIGWEDFNVANWITRLQTKEYILLARGWVRMLSGLQGLLSAYLMVLWFFAYFARPFEW